jgi:acyl-CoA synthetase (AMP-forming)/AMP-acid ligase II
MTAQERYAPADSAVATIPALLERMGVRESSALESLEAPPAGHAVLAASAGALAEALRMRGVGRGDRIVVISPNSAAMVTAFLGAASVGSCAPLNPAYGRSELDFFLGDLAATILLVAGELSPSAGEAVRDISRAHGIPVVEFSQRQGAASGVIALDGQALDGSLSVRAEPHDVALLLHTSGTTSRPKLVPLTHGNLMASVRHVAATLALGPADRSLTIMPLFHIHGLVAGLLAPLAAGGAVIVPPGFLAPEFPHWLARFRPTWYTAVPTMHQAILTRLATPEGQALLAQAPLRFVRSSSAAMSPRLMRDLETLLGAPVIEAYGMTEAAHQMASNPLPPRARKAGSVGPAAGPEIAILGEQGQMLSPGEIGEVAIRGPNVTPGYVSNPTANAVAFTDGWFRTGDQGTLDGDGYLTLAGRLKELINRAGEKIAPLEVDAALAEHPEVAQAICFGIEHPILGEEVAAAVVLKPGSTATPRQLRSFVASKLAYFKVPRQIRIVDRIPSGATGKLQRRGLAELLEVRAQVAVVAGDTTPPRTPVEEIVAASWAQVLQRDVPGVHENFFSLGGDSMLAARVMAQLRSQLRVDLPLLTLFDTPTVAGIAGECDRLLSEAPGDG